MSQTYALRGTPIEPFGVEIDFDLREMLTDQQQAMLRDLRARHHLLLFRNQALTLEEQIRVISTFGPILQAEGEGLGYVSNKHERGILGNDPLDFHADLDFSPNGSYYIISLHAVVVPDGKTSTFFTSMKRGYDALPADLKERVGRLDAIDVWIKNPTGRNRVADLPPGSPQFRHPLVRTLPVSGDNAIHASRTGTSEIVGLDYEESEALLETILGSVYHSSNVYEHRWNTGDIVIWDNRALQHRRGGVSPDEKRTLQRVVSAEEGAGFRKQFPQFTLDQYRHTAAG
ncbi:TauD/TfdA family dioxygenase [soil metagenome]